MEDDDFSAAVRAAFVEEAGELLRLTERHLDAFTGGEGDARAEGLTKLKRVLHTLKGTGAAVGFTAIQHEAHALEDLLKDHPDPEAAPPDALRDRLYQGLDVMNDVVEGRRSPLADAPDQGSGGAPETASDAAPSGTAPPGTATPAVPPPDDPAAGGPSAPPPRREAPAPETTPVAKAPPKDTAPPPRRPATARPAEPAAPSNKNEVVRIRADRLDALHGLVGELVVEGLQNQAITRQVRRLQEDLADLQRAFERARSEVQGLRGDLPEARWRPLAGDLEGVRERLAEVYSRAAQAAREAPMIQAQAATSIKALDGALAELRLVRLQTFLEGFGRSVRDAARATQKRVKLEVHAGDAEMDHMVLMRLREPLLHLVRNAVVHGIEDPDLRERLGKGAEGTIRLDAVCRGGQAVIRVMDDGGGVPVDTVLEKARDAGITADESIADDGALLDLLCHPGFSTHAGVDALAGRGVGMDVVSSSIRNVDGRLGLDNMPGIGAVFTIEVPITASTASGCRVLAGGQAFGLMMKQVERIVRADAGDLIEVEGRRVLYLDGAPLHVVPLAKLLGLPAAPPPEARLIAAVVNLRRERLALLVDDVPEEQTMVVRPLGQAFARSRLFLGGAVQADHSVLPLVHIPELFRRANRHRGAAKAGPVTSAPGAPEAEVDRTFRVLAVDDSMTIRTMMRRMLEEAGFEVTLANDGQQGLSAYEADADGFDLVVTDLEMPQLDGVGLTRGVRASRRPHTPVIMVTSVQDASQKRRALEAGADSYVLKRELQEESFVKLIGRLSGRSEAGP